MSQNKYQPMFRALIVTLCLAAPSAHAACAGADLRATLSPQERALVDEGTAATPYAQGNHWIARRDDRTIHLIGTMHLDHPRWPGVVDRLRPAIENAERLFVEMDTAEQARMQEALAQDPSLIFLTDGPTLPDLMEDEDWERLKQAMSDRGMPAFMVAKTQPWMLSMLLGMPGCAMTAGQDAARGLDHRLMEVAGQAGVPIAPLEGYEEVLGLFADDPLERQLSLLVASLPMAEGSEDQFATLTGAYFDEFTAEVWGITRVLADRHMDMPAAEIETLLSDLQDRLLTRRNLAWMEHIRAAPERRLAVAVGALHLSGETGVLRLLEADGYSLERAPF